MKNESNYLYTPSGPHQYFELSQIFKVKYIFK